jgi:hypothetical protein
MGDFHPLRKLPKLPIRLSSLNLPNAAQASFQSILALFCWLASQNPAGTRPNSRSQPFWSTDHQTVSFPIRN